MEQTLRMKDVMSEENYDELVQARICPVCFKEHGTYGNIIPNGSNHCFVCHVCGTPFGSCQD